MFRRATLFSVIAVLATGCSTQAVMSDVLRSWEGASIAEVNAQWGPAHEQYADGSNTVMVWKNDMPEYRELSRVSTTKYNIFKGASHETRSAGVMEVRKTCDRILRISPQGYVTKDWSWRGTNCPPFKAEDYRQWKRMT